MCASTSASADSGKRDASLLSAEMRISLTSRSGSAAEREYNMNKTKKKEDQTALADVGNDGVDEDAE